MGVTTTSREAILQMVYPACPTLNPAAHSLCPSPPRSFFMVQQSVTCTAPPLCFATGDRLEFREEMAMFRHLAVNLNVLGNPCLAAPSRVIMFSSVTHFVDTRVTGTARASCGPISEGLGSFGQLGILARKYKLSSHRKWKKINDSIAEHGICLACFVSSLAFPELKPARSSCTGHDGSLGE